MINANELRVGNVLLRKNKFDGKPRITRLIGMMIFQAEREPEEFEPIILTPEIFYNCGFSPDSNGWKLKISESLFLWWGNLEQTIRLCSTDVDWSCPVYLKAPIYHFQYLHQLQNLYFALVGEELTIKP